MKSIILPTLADTISGLPQAAKQTLQPETLTVGFFDLSGSTPMKHSQGHTAGVEKAIEFIHLASQVVTECNGVVVKELGDGILCWFSDSIDGCRAALNVKKAADDLDIGMSVGLTIGRIDRYKTAIGVEDILGDAVDRCARIQSLASTGQILVDKAFYEIVKTHLRDFDDVLLGDEFEATAKGIGSIYLREISTKALRLVGKVATPLAIHAGGRLSIKEKVQFMNQADTEIIEIGIGLTSFGKYFTGQKPEEFQAPIRKLLKRGVSLRCYALDPAYEPGQAWLVVQGDEGYAAEAARTREIILKESKACRRNSLSGAIEYHAYSMIPVFHCLGVDVDDPQNGRIMFSPYLPGLSHAECPVYQVSRRSEPELYSKYLTSIIAIRDCAKQSR